MKKLIKLALVVLTGVAVFGAGQALAVNLVTNGDFEIPEVTNSSKWQIFPSGTAGLVWTVEWAGVYPGAPAIANIELHEGVLKSAYSGDQSVEMDSDWSSANGEPASIKIYQDIATCAGGEYTFSYAWTPRPDPAVSKMEVYWGGNLVGNHSGSGSQTWHLVTLTGLTASGATTRIEFVETGNPDSLGMFLDAVSVEQTKECVVDEDGDGSPSNLDCNDNDATIYPGAPDAVCNGIDNDCDSTVDEDYVNTPTSCGVGQCGATGEMTCVSGVEVDTCTAGIPVSETCDNLDNDCDGTTDEDLTRPTNCGIGQCGATGFETCTAGVWGGNTCIPGTPTTETCDGLDNDCDAATDEEGICEYLCASPTIDSPDEVLGTNRWIWNGSTWETLLPKGKGPQFPFTLTDTHNCGCEQILTWLHANLPESYGNMEGHWKYGCSKSVIEDFIRLAELPAFTASASLYYDGPDNSYPLYGSGPISFTWNPVTGHVTGGYYTEQVPPYTGTLYYNMITGGSVVGSNVNLIFDRVDPNVYHFTFTGTLVGNVLTGMMDGPYYFEATGTVTP